MSIIKKNVKDSLATKVNKNEEIRKFQEKLQNS